MSRQKLLQRKARMRKVISAVRARADGSRLYLQGDGAYAVLDVGACSASGHTVFTVNRYKGNCKLRFSYSDRLCVFDYPEGRERGDFSRGAATYLGVELPVLPADPYRFELFTLCRTGTYVHPLVQGQYRFVCVTLIGDGEAELNNLYTINTSVSTGEQGDFACSDANLTNLWHIGARTVAIATIRARQTDTAENKLLLRPLNKGDNVMALKGEPSQVGEAEFSFSITENPRSASAAVLCLKGENSTVTVRLCSCGKLECTQNGKTIGTYKADLVYDRIYEGKLIWHSGAIVLTLSGNEYRFAVTPAACSFGFKQGEDDWAVVHRLHVTAGGQTADGLCLKNWHAFMGEWFISDGAKRDRLPWSGDLEWAGKNAYYCFGGKSKMKDTIAMLLNKQNPEGYYFAVTYPEDRTKPKSRDWGLYQSDIFSCWMTVVMHRYVLFTGDLAFAKKHYAGIGKSLRYLQEYIGDDGLFEQRYETSKGLWDNELGDVGKNTYANILIGKAFALYAELAERLGHNDDAAEYAAKSEKLRIAIEDNLFDEKSGLYVKSKENRDICDKSSPLALALGFATSARAKQICDNRHKLVIESGKILSLLIEGLFRYGFTQEAYAILIGENAFTTQRGFSSTIDWYRLSEREDCPHTTSECGLPPRVEGTVQCWGDRSHPDTALSHILSGWLLGVRPTAAGFGKFVFEPNLCGLSRVEGTVPTPYGDITARADKEGMYLRFPQNLVWENAAAYPDCVIEKYEGGRK